MTSELPTLLHASAWSVHIVQKPQDYISHWDLLGLTPCMRYTLAGGEAYEAENIALGYGGKSDAESLKEAQQWLMDSPRHKKNILDKWHNQVNLGVACNESACAAVQRFESNYVSFSVQPTILKGILRFPGNLKGDFTFRGRSCGMTSHPIR